ncbi:MAG: glycosyltransferase [Planctomycetes bacterium]|nr:glycosyltransferase [Planctomycetota bacterium]
MNVLGSGGSERNIAMICKHIDQGRFRPEVWTLIEGGDYEHHVRGAGVPIRCLRRGRSYNPFFALYAARQIARSGADVIHAFSPAIAFYAALARRLFGLRRPMIYYEGNSRDLGSSWKISCTHWTARQFTHLMANSAASAKHLASKVSNSAEIRVIHNGHATDAWKPDGQRVAVRGRLGISPDAQLAVFVGRLAEQKRVCDLVDAVGRIVGRYPRLRVIVIGDGPLEAELKQQAQRERLENVILFLGWRSDVPQLLMASDLFVYPSRFDGLANAVIEAALAGLPIVACDADGVRDVVRHDEHALLVPPQHADQFAAAIVDVLENPQQARARAQAAQQHAQQSYAIGSSLEKLVSFYDEILAERRGDR